MSTKSTNLNLDIPQLTDKRRDTILQIASNFEVIDAVADVFIDQRPTEGYYLANQRFYNSEPKIGNYIGWINIREGESAPNWLPKTYYEAGDKVIDSTDNSHYYTCLIAGYSSPIEPYFPLERADKTQDIASAIGWTSGKYYNLDNIIIVPSVDDCYFLCIQEGNVGSNPPIWITEEGAEIEDGDVIWEAHKIITWQESGTSSNFRPFGKIE